MKFLYNSYIKKKLYSQVNKLKSKNYFFYGQYSFLIGVFLLASALPISVFFLLISLLISLKKNMRNIFKDNWNKSLILISILMVASYGFKIINLENNEITDLIKESWIDLFNWLPLFLAFYGFQTYLANAKQRILFAKALLLGLIPVIFSCLAQYWFGWFGPHSTFFGLITWYQKPFENSQSGLTGLFSNPNYTGYWLSTIIPFSLLLFIKNKSNKFKSFLYLFNFFLILYLLIHTSSRNGILSIVMSTLLIFSSKLIFTLLLLILLILLLIYLFKSFLPLQLIALIDTIIPTKLINKLFSFSELNLNYFHRYDTYKNTLQFILKKPIFGWGASTFGILYFVNSGLSPTTHTHNIILEVAYNYGPIVSLIFTIFIINLLYKSFISVKIESNYGIHDINRFWLTSSLCSVIFHFNDIPYYDGKISLLFWILLSGLKCILDEKEYPNQDKFY